MTDFRSELPSYCFPDGQPKPKKKGKRVQQNVGEDVQARLTWQAAADAGTEEVLEEGLKVGPYSYSRLATADLQGHVEWIRSPSR
jgi:hypothetical protein